MAIIREEDKKGDVDKVFRIEKGIEDSFNKKGKAFLIKFFGIEGTKRFVAVMMVLMFMINIGFVAYCLIYTVPEDALYRDCAKKMVNDCDFTMSMYSYCMANMSNDYGSLNTDMPDIYPDNSRNIDVESLLH